MSERYYNQFNAQKHYTGLRFLAGDGLQSRELNEMQDTARHHIEGIADAIFSEGDRIADADIAVDENTGAVTLTAGRIYLRGAVREVGDATFVIPTDERVSIGLRFRSEIITHLEDPSLRDPSPDTRNSGEPGAQRLKETVDWGWEGETGSDGSTDAFHAVYTVVNGVLENKTQPPAFDAVVQTVARYDREANGSYIASGLRFRYLELDSNEHVFSLSEGVGNVSGFKVEKPQSTRLRWPYDPDLRAVNSEPHVFADGGSGTTTLTMNRTPVHSVAEITITKEVTETITHGGFTGASDTLQNPQVLSIENVVQGGTTYTEGTDFVRSGDEVDWSPGGAEPAPGSSYDVTYRFIDTISADSFDDETVTVSGAVTGTNVFIDYEWRMPRVDALAMGSEGELFRIKGVSQTSNPQPPKIADHLLLLSQVTYDWFTGSAPTVAETGVRAVPISDIEDMQDALSQLFDLVAIERLRNDTSISDPTAKYGVFVDPLNNDDLRDSGEAQTGAVVDGFLTLPIAAAVLDADTATQTHTLDFTYETVLAQTQQTAVMKINPYQNFDPVPAEVELSPSSDSWTTVNTQWASSITRSFITRHRPPRPRWALGPNSRTTTSVTTRVVSSEREAALTARVRDVDFTLQGFGPNEVLSEVTFDGVDVTPDPAVQADANGEVNGTFTIPAGVPTGTKEVAFTGAGGSRAQTDFVSNGWVVTQTMQQVVTRRTRQWWRRERRVDPLAQTFTLEEDTAVGAVDIWFGVIGDTSKEVRVQIRETQVGFPTQVVLAEGRVDMSTVTAGVATQVTFDPTFLTANTEYAIVILTDDADHAVQVAELGKFDPSSGWVTSQPYTVGVLLSSSNASTWTAHQERDLKFRLKACRFTNTEKVVNLGSINVTDASDLIALAAVERMSSETDAVFVMRDTSNQEFVMAEGQALNLSARVSDTLTVEARLSGTDKATPILFPGAQAIAGNIAATGDYVSRAMQAAASFAMSVHLDVLLPGASTIQVFVEDGAADTWTELTLDSGSPIGDGFEERIYSATGLSGVGVSNTTRIKIVLNGSPSARPYVANLRGFAK